MFNQLSVVYLSNRNELKKKIMKTTRIFINAEETKATVINVFGSGTCQVRRSEDIYTIKGDRWVTELSDLKKMYPNAEVLKSL